jgi:hypothetical protein
MCVLAKQHISIFTADRNLHWVVHISIKLLKCQIKLILFEIFTNIQLMHSAYIVNVVSINNSVTRLSYSQLLNKQTKTCFIDVSPTE